MTFTAFLMAAIVLAIAIDHWMLEHSGALGAIAQRWFGVMRDCGEDVRELLHDGHPTACAGDAAFGYVNAFTAHVIQVGFMSEGGSGTPVPELSVEVDDLDSSERPPPSQEPTGGSAKARPES